VFHKLAREQNLNGDDIMITDETIAIMAGIATTEVEGVASMSGGITEDFVEALGRINPAKGVKVDSKNGTTVIDLYVILKYGFRIPEISWNIQEKVKDTIEQMAGVEVSEINIHVQGIDFEEESL